MNCAATPASNIRQRHWLASLNLRLQRREHTTRVVSSRHEGPLRVQRPFYPEPQDCCHVYLLHPPGGMVIGDELRINATLEPGANGLLTTPSAGKVYGAKGADLRQQQTITLALSAGSCLEWLPQETIIFNSANAHLNTRVDLAGDALYFGWDIVRLGRAASGETFATGLCQQSLEIYREGRPLLIERNRVVAGGELQTGLWGLQNNNTFATLVATCQPSRQQVDNLCEQLDALAPATGDCWGLTQKRSLFIGRYLGNDVSLCRKGFELLWRNLRPCFNQREPVAPRIWNT